MASRDNFRIHICEAEQADVPALVAIKGEGSEGLHLDRLHAAQEPGFRYLVLLADMEIIGFACQVIRRPNHWSDAGDTRHLPQIVDLQVKEAYRGRGYGSTFVRAIEQIVSAAGFRQIFLSVDPSENPRAYTLYQRLGYVQLQPESYRRVWEFRDSKDKVHRGEDRVVDMMKVL